VLYWILPALLFAMDMDSLAQIVVPIGWGNYPAQLLSAAVQAVVAAVLAARRIRESLSGFRSADGA
jgi:hypothetical protein